MITVNKQAALNNISQVVAEAIAKIQALADNGQTSYTINYCTANSIEAWDVVGFLKKEGVECIERGFSCIRKHDGSYATEVKLRLIQ